MNPNKSLIKIASKEQDDNLMIRKSNSDVYKFGDKCYKHYFGIDEKIINQYHTFQNWITNYPVTISLNSPDNELSPINAISLGGSDNEMINYIEFKSLELGNKVNIATDIEGQESIVVSEVPYIEGKTLFDLCYENSDDFDYQINIYNILKHLNSLFLGNMSVENPIDKFQIHGINCKIIGIKNNTLYITITDVARNIQEMVEKNKEKIESLINKKR